MCTIFGARKPQFSSVQFSSQSCQTLCDPMDFSTPGFPVYHQLPGLAQTHVNWMGMPSNHLILCHPLLLPPVPPSIRVFSNESTLRMRWPKYWRFSFSISSSSEYSGLISFRIDWFDLLSVQGTLKSLLQDHNLKASVLQHSGSLWPSNKTFTTYTFISCWLILQRKYNTVKFMFIGMVYVEQLFKSLWYTISVRILYK